MIYLIPAILFSLSANIDNVAIGISYGIKKINILFYQNLFIAFCTSCITYYTMIFSKALITYLNANIANLIGAISLILIGVFTILFDIFMKKDKKSKTEKSTKELNLKKLLLIVLTLSVNNIATGIAASFAGINVLFTLIFTFIFGALFLYIGNIIGKKVVNNTKFEKYSNLFASLILILLGILEILI